MPLHRDIHWLGRQWAVTGHGLQLINQKQMGYYDIEIARLWEPGVIEAMQSKAWIDRPDFDKAVETARSRFEQYAPGGLPPPPVTPVLSPPARVTPPPARRAPAEQPGPTVEELLARLRARSAAAAPAARPIEAPPEPEPLPRSEPPKLEMLKPEPALPETASFKPEPPKPPPPPTATAPAASAPARPALPAFTGKIAGSAKFVRPWRARLTRWHRTLPGLPPRP